MKSKIYLLLLAVLLVISGFFYGHGKKEPAVVTNDGVMQVTFLDVGQGDCSIIKLPNTNEIIMIDSGEAEQAGTIASFLNANGIDTIDYLIATHPHSDHIGAIADIVSRYTVKNIYMPKVYHDTKTYLRLLTAVKSKNVPVTEVKPGVTLPVENVSAMFLAPNADEYDELNNYSAVLSLKYGDTSFLFTGDAEKASEKEMLANGYDLYADVLKVGHHGSNTSSSKKFLKAVKPSYAIISADGVSYNHPHKKTIETLNECNPNIEILRTYERGNITFLTDGNAIDVSTEK